MPSKKEPKKRKLRQKQKQKQTVKTNVKVSVQSSGGAGGTPSFIPSSFRPDNSGLVSLVESINRRLSSAAPIAAPVAAPVAAPEYNPQNDIQTVDSIFNAPINTDIPITLGAETEQFGQFDLQGKPLPKKDWIRVGESPAEFQMRMEERAQQLSSRRRKGKEQRAKASAPVVQAEVLAVGEPSSEKVVWE